ncbi:MAG TPA: universal stress protein [Vicinamibacterales bacterium]|nr:universal stress protein [Vicinamibacterales bacterium]
MTPIRTILVPTDLSDPADAAWKFAQGLARSLKSRIHLLHVVSTPFLYDAWGTEGAALRAAEVLGAYEDAARKELARLVPRRGALRGRVVAATRTGLAVDQILDYIATHRIDLVVMGTHGRGVVGHLLLGSVAERVVQHSPVPVLTLHGASSSAPAGKRRAPSPRPGRGRRRSSSRKR